MLQKNETPTVKIPLTRLTDEDPTPVTIIVELIDCKWEDDTPVTGLWDVEHNDGINVVLFNPMYGKILAPVSKCRFVNAIAGIRRK